VAPVEKHREYVPVRAALSVYCVFFAALVGVSFWQYTDIRNQCRDGALNRSAIRASIFRGFGNLGYRYDEELGRSIASGLPLAYYRDNPAEREQVRRQLEQQLELFPPINC
jgi:hypothetical protein